MRAMLILVSLVCVTLAGCVAGPSRGKPTAIDGPDFDPYDPVLLNELAVAKVKEGDITTAWILMERAARIAPHDPRIGRNLAVLRAYREGTPQRTPGGLSTPPQDASSAQTGSMPSAPLSEPPPLWTAK